MLTFIENLIQEARSAQEPRIVVVDDEPEILELLVDVFQASGLSVTALDHPACVADRGTELRPDVFLIDMMLPAMSGIELAEELRAGEHADTPMIAMSASGLMRQVATDSHLFQETLPKPFEISAMVDAVKRCVSGAGYEARHPTMDRRAMPERTQ